MTCGNARGETRTHIPLPGQVFETCAYTIPPLGLEAKLHSSDTISGSNPLSVNVRVWHFESPASAIPPLGRR
jgi:hypothetical protein